MKMGTEKIPVLACAAAACLLIFAAGLNASEDIMIKERKTYGKSIRTRMPPQILIDAVQNDLNKMSPEWSTFWQNFVVEDDQDRDEFVIIARSVEKPWAFGVLKVGMECVKPDNFDDLKSAVEKGGTPVRMDMLVGIKKRRFFFRYTINVYDPMYPFWKNPCYTWNLAPGKAKDKFYSENYTMEVYAKNLKQKVYDLVSSYSSWKPPKKVKKIPAIKGPGVELIGGEAEGLTDEEKKLSIKEQEKILEQKKNEKKKK